MCVFFFFRLCVSKDFGSFKHDPEDKIKRPGFVRRYLLDRVIMFITDSTSRLEKVFPTVFQIYKTFKTGI
jgi:hypothetical protein